MGTIAVLVVAVCTLQRSTTTNTFLINVDTSKLGSKYDPISIHPILRILLPEVDDSKTETTKNSSLSNTILTTLPTSPSKKSSQSILKEVSNKTHNSEDTPKKQPATNNTSYAFVTSQKFTNKSMLKHNTSKALVPPETHHTTNFSKDQGIPEEKPSVTEYLTNSNSDDFEIMQKQLNLTYCLIFYIEKEKMEYAKLDLWGVYVTLKTAPLVNTTVTATEKYITTIIETVTGWTIEDVTKNQQITQITDELTNTVKLVQQMKDFLSITNINTMRIYQNGYKVSERFLSQQLLKNYESETTLLNLQHQLYIERPTGAPHSDMSDALDTLIYYPLLQRYVSLLVDTLSAKNTCLIVESFL